MPPASPLPSANLSPHAHASTTHRNVPRSLARCDVRALRSLDTEPARRRRTRPARSPALLVAVFDYALYRYGQGEWVPWDVAETCQARDVACLDDGSVWVSCGDSVVRLPGC